MDGCKTSKVWKPPEFIWLQREDEFGNLADSRWDGEIYWCDERIYASDVRYRRVDDEEELETD
jgi:hypothetical protein